LYSARSDRYELLRRYHELGGSHPGAPSEIVERKLVENGIGCAAEYADSAMNMSSCFHSGRFDPNEDGRMMLSLTLRTDWDALSQTMRRSLGRTLTEICDKNGARSLVLRNAYIWISD
jgi:hypothetical protein